MKQSYLYVLELEHGLFFIGYAVDVESRIAKCFNGTANKATRFFKPIRVVEICKGDKWDLLDKSDEYANLYGRDRILDAAYRPNATYDFRKRKYVKFSL